MIEMRVHLDGELSCNFFEQDLSRWWYERSRPSPTPRAVSLLGALRSSAQGEGVEETILRRLLPLSLEWDMRAVSRHPGWERGKLNARTPHYLGDCEASFYPFRYEELKAGLWRVDFRPLMGGSSDLTSCKMRPWLVQQFAPALTQESGGWVN